MLKNWKLQISTIEGDWTTPTGWIGEANKKICCQWQEFSFEKTEGAKFFRLLIISNQGGEYLALGKLEFRFVLGP